MIVAFECLAVSLSWAAVKSLTPGRESTLTPANLANPGMLEQDPKNKGTTVEITKAHIVIDGFIMIC